jgi:hypothetical protein
MIRLLAFLAIGLALVVVVNVIAITAKKPQPSRMFTVCAKDCRRG